jgi:hypothetical protein
MALTKTPSATAAASMPSSKRHDRNNIGTSRGPHERQIPQLCFDFAMFLSEAVADANGA